MTAVHSPIALLRLLLCSRIALPRDTQWKPLRTSEWSGIERVLSSANIDPGEILSASPAQLAHALAIAPAEAQRIAGLLSRSGPFAVELEEIRARGIWALTRGDPGYPQRWLTLLSERAPIVLFGAGDRRLLSEAGIAVVGSRNVADHALAFACRLGEVCAQAERIVISGAARGVDRAAMTGALESDGRSVGILADDLTRVIREPQTRQWIEDSRIALVTAFHYSAPFSVGMAMARNKLIYCLSEAAVIVASELTGGTWEGAQENLKARWVPMFARDDEGVPAGNLTLLKAGAHSIRTGQLTPAFIESLSDAELPPVPKSERQPTLSFE